MMPYSYENYGFLNSVLENASFSEHPKSCLFKCEKNKEVPPHIRIICILRAACCNLSYPTENNISYDFLFAIFFVTVLDLDGTPSDETCTSGGDNSNPGSIVGGPEDDQARLRLKRKLQRNRTSFTNDQIDSLEKGEYISKVMKILCTYIPGCVQHSNDCCIFPAPCLRPFFVLLSLNDLSYFFFFRIRTHSLSGCIRT